MDMSKRMSVTLRLAGAICLAAMLSGCVIVPVHPWHPHYGYY